LYSCSLQCFKSHQSQCEVFEGKSIHVDGEGDASLSTKTPNLAEPAFNLINRQGLEKLLERYPTLRSKLKAIFDVTQDRGEAPGYRNDRRGRLGNVGPDRAYARGLALLKRQIEANDADAEALQAFMQYFEKNTG
jgi:hypothetical protein